MKGLPRPLIVLAVGLALLAALPLKVITRQDGLTAISDDQLRAAKQ